MQRRELANPTMIRVEGQGLTPAETLRLISQQSGFALESNNQTSQDRLINARGEAALPFWRAVDRFGLTGPHFDPVS